MLDIRRLQLLRELEARGSIAAVSRALDISASAVSQQLTKLAREVGMTLVEQTGRNVQLTPVGRELALRGGEVITLLDEIEAEIESRGARLQGLVRLAAFGTFALQYLPELLQRMRRSHPDVVIEFSQVEPAEALDAVAGRRAEIAITDDYPHLPRRVDEQITRTHLAHDPVIPYASRPVSRMSDLGELSWVFEPAGSDARDWAQRVCREAGFEPVVAFQSPDLRVHIELVRTGQAAALIPRMALRNVDWPGERAHRISWPSGPGTGLFREVYAVTHRGVPRLAVAATLQHLRELVRDSGP